MIKNKLENLYNEYNKSSYIKFDPIKYVYQYTNPVEQELVGLIVSSLAFGRVKVFFRACDQILNLTESKPLSYIQNLPLKTPSNLKKFKYRFVDGEDVFNFFKKVKLLMTKHQSLGQFIKSVHEKNNLKQTANLFTQNLYSHNYLIPKSIAPSPCKRLFMFFRWMVRKDKIDLGLWNFIEPSELIIPLDTHIFSVAKQEKLTQRSSYSFNTAVDITNNLKKYSTLDPVKYDWALSHIPIIKNNFSN